MKWVTVGVWLLLLWAGAGCGDRRPQKRSARDSAGVAIIENPGSDSLLSWRLDSVGHVTGGQGGVDLNEVTEYTVDADTLGHIFILDRWYGQRLQVVDTTGQLIGTITRGGGGPAELGQGVSVSVGDDGVVSVMDFTRNGLVRLRHDGTTLPLFSLTGYSLFGGARASADTVVLHTMDLNSITWQEQIQYRTATDTGTLTVFKPERLGMVRLCRDSMEGLTPMLAPDLRWTARGSQVAISKTAEYRVDLYAGSRLIRVVRRSIPATSGNADAVRRFFPEGKIVGSMDCTLSASELVDRRGVAPTVQAVRRLAIDLEGRLWVERNTFPDEKPRVDVFARTGEYLGTLVGFGAPLAFPSRTLMAFAVPSSSSGESQLGIFRVPSR